MAEKQAEDGLKGDASRKQAPRKTRPAAKKRAPKIKPSIPFELTGTNENRFRIGDSARDVVLTGSGLDTEGLRAVIVDLQPGDVVLIEQPDPDSVLADEFPITVQVVEAARGQRRFAVTKITLVGNPPMPVTLTSTLDDPIWFE